MLAKIRTKWILYLLTGIILQSGLHRVDAVISASVISAIAGSISAGVSLTGTTTSAILNGLSGSVAITVKVENFSKWPLVRPSTFAYVGQIIQSPLSIAPGSSEVIKAQKTSGTVKGTTGCASWLVDDRNLRDRNHRIYAMWSVPWNHNYYNNRLAVGIRVYNTVNPYFDCGSMYYEAGSWYNRRDYRSSVRPVEKTCSGGGYRIEGTMGTDYRVHATIRLVPTREENLADNLKEELRKYRQNNRR